MIRKATVAGQFYPSSKTSLLKQLQHFTQKEVAKRKVIAVIMPHAGYMYSGAVAGKTISNVEVQDRAVILGPNHTGLGRPYSIMSIGTWETPLGMVDIDTELATFLLDNSQLIKQDESAHLYEHSIEVELPFLQFFCPALKIVPMVVSDLEIFNLKKVGEEIALGIKNVQKPTLIVASSDMTHYETQTTAKHKDQEAIDAIVALDPEKLLTTVKRRNISMCGIAPVSVAIFAALKLGAKAAQLIEYQTSGDVTGDYSSVVGYAGFIIQ